MSDWPLICEGWDRMALTPRFLGYYDGDKLMYVARTRNGFVPALRRQESSKLKHLVTPACPFLNLPEARRSRFGEELNAEKMKKAVWLKQETVAQIEFLEWTEGTDCVIRSLSDCVRTRVLRA